VAARREARRAACRIRPGDKRGETEKAANSGQSAAQRGDAKKENFLNPPLYLGPHYACAIIMFFTFSPIFRTMFL
jgi:hypothetical protein